MTSTIETTHQWLTVKRAAEMRGLTYRRVIEWVRVGLLPTSRPTGGQHLVRLSDLDSVLAAGYVGATRGPLVRQAERTRT